MNMRNKSYSLLVMAICMTVLSLPSYARTRAQTAAGVGTAGMAGAGVGVPARGANPAAAGAVGAPGVPAAGAPGAAGVGAGAPARGANPAATPAGRSNVNANGGANRAGRR